MAELTNMGSDANYPSDDGIRLGLASVIDTDLKPVGLIDVDLLVGGTPGTGASYQIQTQTGNGNWVDAEGLVLSGDGAAATGQVSGTVEGCAVRLAADNGITPGTGANTPRYHLNASPRRDLQVGEYSG